MKIALKFCIALLTLYYAGVLYFMANPQVSAQYKDYFITNTTDLSAFEISQLTPLRFDQTYSFNSASIGFDGWSNAETEFRWSAKKKVKIVFLLQEADISASSNDTLQLHVGPLGKQRIELRINDYELGVYTLENEMQLSVPIKNTELITGKNVLEINLPAAKIPGNGDPRTLGIYIKSFSLKSDAIH